jgi:hypothetical protein
MKKVLFICFILIGCNKPTTVTKYSMVIFKYRIGKYIPGKPQGSLEQDSMVYAIKANNDTAAYVKGFGIWFNDFGKELNISLKDSSTMRSKYIIKDHSGNDLEKKLPQKILDSVKMSFYKSFFLHKK